MIFFSAWNAISLPASMSLIGKSLGTHKTAMGISMHSIIRRFPMMLGPVIGGVLITGYGLVTGIKLSFGISIILCVIGIFFQQKMTVDSVIAQIKISPEQFGYLTAIEMITAAVIYIPVARFSDKLERKPFIVITFIFFAVFPLFLYFSRSYLLLIFAFIIRGLKEFGEPTRKALILELSVKNAEARSFGLYYFIRDMIVSVAAFSGGLLWSISPEVNLFTAFAAGIAGTLFFVFYGKGTQKLKTT